MATLRIGGYVAANIRARRLAQQMTQEQLAEKARLDTKTVSNIETGKTDPDLATIERIADALQVPPHRLLQRALPVKPRRGRPRKAKK